MLPIRKVHKECQVSQPKRTSADFECQVQLPPVQPVTELDPPVTVLSVDKATYTVSPSYTVRECQTDVILKKNKNIQISITRPRTEVTTSSSQTINVIHDVCHNTTDNELDTRVESPTTLEANHADIKEDSTANQRFLFRDTRSREMTHDEMAVSHANTNGRAARTIHVRPESPTIDIPIEIRMMLNRRRTIAYSFFSNERAEEKLARTMCRAAKKLRKKTRTNKIGTEC